MAVIPEHKDVLGQTLAVGDCVVFPSNNSMCVGTIVRFNPKMVKVKALGSYSWNQNKYPQDLARVSGPEVTMYLLTKTKG